MVSVWIAVLCGVDFHSGFSYGYDYYYLYCYFWGESPEKVGILQCCVFQSGALAQRGGWVVLCF